MRENDQKFTDYLWKITVPRFVKPTPVQTYPTMTVNTLLPDIRIQIKNQTFFGCDNPTHVRIRNIQMLVEIFAEDHQRLCRNKHDPIAAYFLDTVQSMTI